MAYGKTCPACGATLDPGETCDCRGSGDRTGFGVKLNPKEEAKKEKERDREQLRTLTDRISWRLVDRPDFGPTVIEADVDGEPAFRFDAYYDPRLGVWRLYPKRVLKLEYKCLHLIKRVYIDVVKDARPKRRA